MRNNNLLILDDEPKSRALVRKLLEEYVEYEFKVEEAKDIKEAMAICKKSQPSIMILDINLPPFTAFDFLNKFTKIDFQVIFMTNYTEFALNAFQFSAVDYIVKPITGAQVKNSIERAVVRTKQKEDVNRVKGLLNNLKQPTHKKHNVLIPMIKNRALSMKVGDIIHIKSKREMTQIYTTSNSVGIISTLGITEWEQRLKAYNFFRTHKQHIINLEFVKYLKTGGSLEIELSNGLLVPLARRRKKDIVEAIK